MINISARFENISRSFNDYFGETNGHTTATTAKVRLNKLTYVLIRGISKILPHSKLHLRYHWYKFPFALINHVLWSRPIQAWFLASDEAAMENMLRLPLYEPTDWVNPQPEEVVLDIGSYIGWYTILSALLVGPSGKVIAIEPEERNRKILEKNITLNKLNNVVVIPKIAWSQTGFIGWHSDQIPVWNKVEQESTFKLPSISIDDLVEELHINRVDWIKIDVEGAELEVLEGARSTLERFHPSIFIEIHETNAAIEKHLLSRGYNIKEAKFDVLPDHHGWILACFGNSQES